MQIQDTRRCVGPQCTSCDSSSVHAYSTQYSATANGYCLLTCRWEDLPAAFVAHILQLVPYKRADVKLVCRDWRAAVNASLKTVTMPAEDLHLLAQCPAVQTLILRSSESAGRHQWQSSMRSCPHTLKLLTMQYNV